MAKKKFKEDIDNLLSETEQAQQENDAKVSKGFAMQLDAFLAETFKEEELLEKERQEQEEETTAATSSEKKDSKPRRKIIRRTGKGLSGLDLLIRKTGDIPAVNKLNAPDKKRLTLAFNKTQLAKLEKIATAEGVFLKDLINQLIEQYLDKYKN